MERRYKVPDNSTSRMKRLQRSGLLDSRRGKDEKDSFGLYPPQQTKGENAITFTGGIVVGVIVAICGAAIAYANAKTIIDERAHLGGASPHIGAWLMAVGLMLIGGFLAHAGVIYWCRQIFRRMKDKRR